MFQQLQRFVDGFVRKAEGAVVHGNHPAGFEIEEGAHGVGRIGVNVAELRRIVCADGKQRDLRREAAPDFAKARKISSIASMIDGMLAGLQNEAAIAAM